MVPPDPKLPDVASGPDPWSLQIYGTYKSIPAQKLDGIPPLAVITGPNGSGKSQLFEAIPVGLAKRRELENSFNERHSRISQLGHAEREFETFTREFEEIKSRLQPSDDPDPLLQRSRRSTREKYEAHLRGLQSAVDGYRQRIESLDLQISSTFYAEASILPTGEYSNFNFDADGVALVSDAYQSAVSRPFSPAQANEELRQGDSQGYAYPGTRGPSPPAGPLSSRGSSTAHGRAIDVTQPLDGLGLAMQAYRAEKFDRSEAIERGEPVDPLPPPPWEVVNALFAEAGFALRVAAPVGRVGEAHPVRFVSKGHTVTVEQLSSGERTVVGLASALYAGRNGAYLPRLLLLDEPDAHLHPALTAQVFAALNDVLVRGLGVRIILATHSPSTVALAPDGAVFVMEDGVVRPIDKWAAVSTLTAGIVTVGPNTRFVFVEDHEDVMFYSAVVDVLERLDPTFPKGRLAFLPANKDITDGPGSGGRDRVMKWTNDLATTAVAGLIDYDRGPRGDDPARVWRIGRYAIENYLLDPFLLAAFGSRSQGKALSSYAPFEGAEKSLRTAHTDALQAIVDEVTSLIASCLNPLPDDGTIEVAYVDGPTLRLPDWILKRRGKDINGVVQSALGFPPVPKRLIDMIRLTGLIPQELADTLREIAES